MKYKLTIFKYEENKDYETEMAKYKEKNQYNRMNGYDEFMPVKEVPTRTMEVFLTEEEFKKIKAETFKVFE